jgi:hypothetical protein
MVALRPNILPRRRATERWSPWVSTHGPRPQSTVAPRRKRTHHPFRALKRPATVNGRSATEHPPTSQSDRTMVAVGFNPRTTPPVNRRYATGKNTSPIPGVETPGYHQWSLCDRTSSYVAERQNDGSRGFQPTDKRPTHVPRRIATLEKPCTPCSPPNTPLIILDLMSLQKREVLFLKRPSPMMFTLATNVFHHIRDVGFAHRKHTIPILPREPVHVW